jgi:hypothetical protein
VWNWIHFVCLPLIGLLYQPRVIDEYGAFSGMRTGRGSRNTQRKPAPVPLCPPQISHDMTWDWIRAAVVGSQRLTAWAMAQRMRISKSKFKIMRFWSCYFHINAISLPRKIGLEDLQRLRKKARLVTRRVGVAWGRFFPLGWLCTVPRAYEPFKAYNISLKKTKKSQNKKK